MKSNVHVLALRTSAAVAVGTTIAQALPGVEFQGGAYSPRLLVPYNAKGVVENAIRQTQGITANDVRWTQVAAAVQHELNTRLRAADNARRIAGAPGMRSVVRKPGSEEEVALDDFFVPFQTDGIVTSCDRGFGLFRWPCGSGKGIGGISALASRKNVRGVIVTRASNRIGISREISRYTTEDFDILEGQTPRPIKDCKFLIVGWETLPYWIQSIVYAGKYAVVFDELHKCRDKSRYTSWQDATGWHKVKNTNITAAALDLSRGAVDGAVWGTTATPIENRSKDLYIPLDLLEPAGWGSWKEFALRYAGGYYNSFSGLVAEGKSNPEELAARLAAITHNVPEEVVDRELPGADIIFTALAKQDQCGPEAFAADLKAAARDGAPAVERSQAMRAATKKRPHILMRAEEVVTSGKRFAVMTGRRVDAERLAAEISKLFTSLGMKDIAKNHVFMIHGDVSVKARQETIDNYAGHPQGVMIGTIDSIGESLNGMQGTRWLTYAMVPETAGKLKQSVGRLKRFGQTERATIEVVWAEGDEYDEKAVSRLIKNLPALREVVGDVSMQEFEVGLQGDSDKITASLFDKILAAPPDNAGGEV